MSRFRNKYLKSSPYTLSGDGFDFSNLINAGTSLVQTGIGALGARKDRESAAKSQQSMFDQMMQMNRPVVSSGGAVNPMIIVGGGVALLAILMLMKNKGKK